MEARILVRTEPPGVRLSVHGPLDDEGLALLGEVVRAALVTVKRAHRIHLDLSRVSPGPDRLPRIVQRLIRAGASVTPAPDAGRAGRDRTTGGRTDVDDEVGATP